MNNATFGPVEKLQLLADAASDNTVTRSELALLVVLADMINSTTGLAWPSYNHLAMRTGTTPRSAKRGIQRLVEKNRLIIIEHGNQSRSNRYTMNRETLEGSDAHVTRVVTPVSTCGDAQVTSMVTPTSPESIHQSEHQAKIGWDRQEAPPAPACPEGAAGLPSQKGEDVYPEFWDAIGKRTAVAQAEQAIAAAIGAGVAYQSIVDGAGRFKAYCDATTGTMKMTPAAFVQNEKWRDSWEVQDRKPKAKASTKATTTKAKPTPKKEPAAAEPKRTWTEEYRTWRTTKNQFEKKLKQAKKTQYRHVIGCKTCDASRGNPNAMCDVGKQLHEGVEEAANQHQAWWRQNPQPEQWVHKENQG